MKKNLIFLTMLLALMLLVVNGCGKDEGDVQGVMPQEFSAKMITKTGKQKVAMKIYMKPDKYRTDNDMAGSSTIIRKDLNKVWMIMKNQKSYMEMPEIKGDETQLAEAKIKGEVSRKKIGSETIDGHPATKYEISAKADGNESKVYQWWATDINFPIKTEASDGSWITEYRDINTGSQPDSLFEIPSGYKKITIPGMPAGMKLKIPAMNAK